MALPAFVLTGRNALVANARRLHHHAHTVSAKKACRKEFLSLSALLLLHASTVNCQSFTTKAIGQSTPLPGVTNRITVTLVSDTDLSGNSGGDKVTISGLSGAVASSPVTLLAAGESGDNGFLIFSDGAVQSRGVWNSTTGSLTLTVQTGATFIKSTTYTFSFDITNPSSDMTSPTVNIEASGSVTIASSAMSKPGGAKYGVVNGEHPLTVAVPKCVVVTVIFHGKWVGIEYGPLTGHHHVSISDLFIFIVHDNGHYKMTAVTLVDAQASTTPSTPTDRYISSSPVISLDTTTVSAMWDGTLPGYTTIFLSDGRGYELKDVEVGCQCEPGSYSPSGMNLAMPVCACISLFCEQHVCPCL